MPIPEDLAETTPTESSSPYSRRGSDVCFLGRPIRGAHVASFRYFTGRFAKDEQRCYNSGAVLRDADPTSFRPLNYCYAMDITSAWALGGRVNEADAASFKVLDDGCFTLSGGQRVPYGYARDKQNVYYYDFRGKPSRVRRATPDSFRSLNDGNYAIDAKHVFFKKAAIKNADVKSWRLLTGFYSRDRSAIFYQQRMIEDADLDSFTVVSRSTRDIQLAFDRTRAYRNDHLIDRTEFLKIQSRINAEP